MARRKNKKKSGKNQDESKPTGKTELDQGDLGTSLGGLLKAMQKKQAAETKAAKDAPTKPQVPQAGAAPGRGKSAKKQKKAMATKVNTPRDEGIAAKGVERPSTSLRGTDRTAYYQAYSGVKPIKDAARASNTNNASGASAPSRVRIQERPEVEQEARDRLAALVAGGIHFVVRREPPSVWGYRSGGSESSARALSRKGVVAEAHLDLHGLRGDEAVKSLLQFLREQQRRGARRVCVVHGKGIHSEGGLGVLRDRVVQAVVDGAAAPLVRNFGSASSELGGSGALILELMS